MTMNRRTVLAGIGTGLTGAFAGCTSRASFGGQERRTDEQTYEVDPGTSVQIDNRNGPVTVEGHDGDAVKIGIEITAPSSDALDDVSVDVDEVDGELRIRTEFDDDSIIDRLFSWDRPSVAFTVQCPEGVLVDRARTRNGGVEVRDVEGDPVIESTNGNITAQNVDGTVDLSTNNGRVVARGLGGLAGASSSNGSIDIDVPAIDDSIEIETSNGSIDAAIASSLDATLAAETNNGTVRLHDLDLSSVQTGRSTVDGTLGDGTHDLSIRTNNGSIDLRALD